MNRLDELYGDSTGIAGFARGYLEYLRELLAELDVIAIEAFAQALLAARDRGARVFFLGNGGSAATASHFASDLAIGTRSWTKPFRAISLTDNIAMVTSIANDSGYEDVFTQQLRTQMDPGDVVVAISASGNSPNVVRAVGYANAHGAITVGLTGFDGGELRRISQLGVHVPTGKGEYGPVEDVHMILDHLVSAFLALLSRARDEVPP